MSQIAVGKLLPNLKVTVGNDDTNIEQSEPIVPDEVSELQQENSKDTQSVQIVRSWMNSLQNPKIYKNKGGAFTTGLDLISEVNSEMLDKRAERFGIEKDECSSSETISSLYDSMGVEIENRNSAKMKNIRLDALHMRGVNELNTNEIFQYFKDYGPASVEWINDFSCNVVWMDEVTCARALLGNSKPLKSFKTKAEEPEEEASIHSDSSEPSKSSSNPEESVQLVKETQDVKDEKDEDMDIDNSPIKSCPAETSPSLEIPIPPGNWRLGIPHPKAKSILLRFATKDDKKIPGAEKRSIFYKKYGNPNYGGLVGLISSSRKRKIQAASNKIAIDLDLDKSATPQSAEESLSADELPIHKAKPPRMRMYADDEELKNKNLQYKEKSLERPRSVHSRLGTKYTKEDLFQLGSYHRETERYRPFEDNRRFSSDRIDLWKRDENNQHFSSDRTDSWEKDEDFELLTSPRTDRWKGGEDSHRSSYNRMDRWERKQTFSSNDQIDLRSKIKKMKMDSAITKHRSPLCIED